MHAPSTGGPAGDGSPVLDEVAFAAGEAVSGLAAWGGADTVVIGGKVVAHATPLRAPQEPLTGFGDPVRCGDLASMAGAGDRIGVPVIVNLYDVAANRVNFVSQIEHGYAIAFAGLDLGWRRQFRLLDPAPDGWPVQTNRLLDGDAVTAAFDARFAAAGFARRPSLLDTPIVCSGLVTLHAVPAGLRRTVCGMSLRHKAAGPVFTAAADGVCRRCAVSVAAAATPLGEPADCAIRSVRARVYATRYRRLWFAPARRR